MVTGDIYNPTVYLRLNVLYSAKADILSHSFFNQSAKANCCMHYTNTNSFQSAEADC